MHFSGPFHRVPLPLQIIRFQNYPHATLLPHGEQHTHKGKSGLWNKRGLLTCNLCVYTGGGGLTSILRRMRARVYMYTHHTPTGDTNPRLPTLAGGRRWCGDSVGGPGPKRGRVRLGTTEEEKEGIELDEAEGARPGWHLDPPHVVDLMEGCRSPIRRTGERTRTRAPASNLLHVSTPGSLATNTHHHQNCTTSSGTTPDHHQPLESMAFWSCFPGDESSPRRRLHTGSPASVSTCALD